MGIEQPDSWKGATMRKEKLQDLLEWVDGTEGYIRDLLQKVSGYGSVIIFGAGIGGKRTMELLKNNGYEGKIRAFSDNNEGKIGTWYEGYPIVAPDNILENCSGTFIILISSTAFKVISQQLSCLGIDEESIYFFQPAGISLEDNKDMEFIKREIVNFETVYDMLADEKSKIIYKSLLNYRITKKQSWLDEMEAFIDREELQYFDHEILKGYCWGEGIVDAGAYTGDTINNFYKFFPDAKGEYYCFEAVKTIYDQLCMNIDYGRRGNIFPFNYAVWDKEGELRFDVAAYGNGEGSRESSLGKERVKCSTLDKLLGDKEVDFIKMDIEGAERNALCGGANLIKKNRPVLAICIYHKPEDFYDIPLSIEDMVPDEYTYYVRQYRYGQSETVLYAMPNSRKI